MLLGIALVAASVIGAIVLLASANDSQRVLVASHDIPTGHVIQAGDIKETKAKLEGQLASLAVGGGDLARVVGRTAGASIHAGEMLVWPDLAMGPAIGPNQVAITLPVQADAVYPGLRPGDQVAVLATRDKGKPDSQTVTLLERATVYDISLAPSAIRLGNDSTQEQPPLTNVTLVVDRPNAEQVAHAIVNWQVTLALLSPEAAAAR